MTSQNYVVWKDAFSVGSAAIDAQHKGMFGLLNDLYNALQEGRSQKDISEIVEKARQYAKQHFASEEALWAKSRCPGFLNMMHFVSALPNAMPHHEFKGLGTNVQFECKTSPLKVVDGKIEVSTGSGLGVDIDPAYVRKHQRIKA